MVTIIKKILEKVVVAITCIALLCSINLPVYADASKNDDDYIEYSDADPNIRYSDWLEMSKTPIMTYNLAGAEMLYSFGPEFTAAGAALASAAPYAAGMLIIGGGIAIGGKICYDAAAELIEEGPEAWNAFCTLITMGLESEFVQELEAIAQAMINGEAFTISEGLVNALCEQINLANGVIIDGAGNVISSELVIPAEELAVAFEWTESIIVASENRKWLNGNWPSYSNLVEGQILTASNEYITREMAYFHPALDGINKGWQTLTNNITGAAMTFNAVDSLRPHDFMSRFFMCVDEATGAEFWMMATGANTWLAYNTMGSHVYCALQGLEWFEFSGTGTILDGIRFTGIEWNAAENLWHFTDVMGNITTYPVDPFGMLLSNTGINTGDLGADVASPVPGMPLGDDFPWYVPPFIPVDIPIDTGTGTGGLDDTKPGVQPITTTNTIELAPADVIDKTITDTLPTPTLDEPNKLKDFIGNFWNNIKGLFDWLPKDFTNKMNGVMTALTAMLVIFIVVKIIDIIWP